MAHSRQNCLLRLCETASLQNCLLRLVHTSSSAPSLRWKHCFEKVACLSPLVHLCLQLRQTLTGYEREPSISKRFHLPRIISKRFHLPRIFSKRFHLLEYLSFPSRNSPTCIHQLSKAAHFQFPIDTLPSLYLCFSFPLLVSLFKVGIGASVARRRLSFRSWSCFQTLAKQGVVG